MKPSVCITSFAAYALFHPEKRLSHGGAELDSFLIAKELSKREHRVNVVVGNFGQPPVEQHDTLRVWRSIPIAPSSPIRGLVHTIRLFVVWHRINADVYFTKGAGFLPFQLALFCMVFRKRYFFKTSHRYNVDGSLRHRPYHPFYAWSLRRAEVVFVQNAEDQQLLRAYYGINSFVLRNFQRIPKRGLLLPWNERTHILWVGRLAPIKRPEIVLDIARLLPNERFLMIGATADPTYRKQFEWLLTAQRLPNVALLTDIPHHEIDQYYRHARFLLHTARAEGFPNVFIEALKWGTPIESLAVDPDNLLASERVGCYGEGKPEKLYAYTSTLRTQQNLWQDTSTRAYELAKRMFGIGTIASLEHALAARS